MTRARWQPVCQCVRWYGVGNQVGCWGRGRVDLVLRGVMSTDRCYHLAKSRSQRSVPGCRPLKAWRFMTNFARSLQPWKCLLWILKIGIVLCRYVLTCVHWDWSDLGGCKMPHCHFKHHIMYIIYLCLHCSEATRSHLLVPRNINIQQKAYRPWLYNAFCQYLFRILDIAVADLIGNLTSFKRVIFQSVCLIQHRIIPFSWGGRTQVQAL